MGRPGADRPEALQEASSGGSQGSGQSHHSPRIRRGLDRRRVGEDGHDDDDDNDALLTGRWELVSGNLRF